MPVCDQDHGGVAVPIAVGLGSLDQGLDFARRQVLAAAKLGVRTPPWRNCSIYFGWRDQPQRRLCHMKSPCPNLNCDELRTVRKREVDGESNCREVGPGWCVVKNVPNELLRSATTKQMLHLLEIPFEEYRRRARRGSGLAGLAPISD